jgi:hypothetical protein
MLFNYQAFQLYFNDLEFESEKDHSYALKPVFFADDLRGTSFAQAKKKEGEVDYLILHQHERVGEIAYRHLTDHRVEIFHLKGQEKALELAVDELLNQVSRLVNPVTFVLSGGSKALKEATEFVKKEEPGIAGSHFIRRIVK